MKIYYGDKWQDNLPPSVRTVGGEVHWDTQAILNTMIKQWYDVFQSELGYLGKNLVGELKEWRNEVAHRSAQKPITEEDAFRAVDSIWRLLNILPLPQAQQVRAIRDELQPQSQNTPAPATQEIKQPQKVVNNSVSCGEPAVTYTFSRLCFKASKIEPLQPDEAFRVVTPVGTFQMTKAEFYNTFPKVVESKSYAQSGLYHYPSVPQRALPYKLPE